MTNFDKAFDQLIGLEGKFTDDEKDPGNWTGGKVNVGQLKGTNWGISAASYPDLDIQSISRDYAKGIYLTDFWQEMRCDAFPPRIASSLFKQGVNMGTRKAVKILQRVMRVEDDGIVGEVTIGHAHSMDETTLLVYFLAECALDYTKSNNFAIFGRGWMRRVLLTAVQS